MSYVLIIEDDSSLSSTLTMYLQFKIVDCLNVDCYEKVDECIKNFGPPSFVLLDYIHQTKEIIELLRRNKKTKIVLMTARTNSEQIFKELDVDFLLKKPFSIDDLDAVLNM